METRNLKNFLDSFSNQVVRDARAKLASSKDSIGKARGATQLGASIRSQVVRTERGFTTQFYMYEYGEFLDKGVSGTKEKQSFKNYKGGSEETEYSYKNAPGHSQPPSGVIEKWIKRKGIKGFVNKNWKGGEKRAGQPIPDKSLAFLIARGIGRHGIKSISFFQEPLGIGYRKLKKQMLEKVKLDIETYLVTFYR